MRKKSGKDKFDKDKEVKKSERDEFKDRFDAMGKKDEGRKGSGKDFRGRKVSRAINEESYYIPSDGETLYDQTLNFSFNQFLGVPTVLFKDTNGVPGSIEVPAFARYSIAPSAGWTDSTNPNNAGVNKLGLKNYLALSAGNAKTTSYTPNDVTTLLLAFGQLIAMVSWMTRPFGLYFTFNQRNRAVPEAAIEAAGFDFADFKANYNQYRIELNSIINAANKIPIPANIKYFKKCAEIYAGVYLDHENSAMAQAYMFAPQSTWILDEAYSPQGTGCKTIRLLEQPAPSYSPDYTMLYSQALTILDGMVTAMATSTTMNSIYSDVKRLQEKESLQVYTFGMVGEDYRVTPAYVPELETWIHNARVIGSPVPASDHIGTGYTADNDVAPDINNNCVTYRPQFHLHTREFDEGYVVDFRTDTPSRAERCYATRLTARFRVTYDSGQGIYYSTECALADFYLTGIVMYSADGSSNKVISRSVENTSTWGTAPYLRAITQMGKFDWQPILYVFDPLASSGDYIDGVFGDLNYYTILDFKTIKAIDDVCMTGLLEI